MSDPRVVAGLTRQLEARAALLGAGATGLGWKVALNAPAVQELLGIDGTVIGSMTSASLLGSGAQFDLEGPRRLPLRPNWPCTSGGRSIAGYGAAIEIVDVDLPFEDLERILEENVFHRQAPLSPPVPEPPASLSLRVTRNGALEAQGLEASDAVREAEATVAHVAELLEAVARRLEPSEVIIGGAIAPLLFVAAGDRVSVELDPLGSLEVGFSA